MRRGSAAEMAAGPLALDDPVAVAALIEVRLPFVFPPGNILIALIGTVGLALLVLFFPVRRAARFRPGDALRHA